MTHREFAFHVIGLALAIYLPLFLAPGIWP